MVITISMKLASALSRAKIAGCSLLEANVATAMVGSFLSAVMIMNANLLGVIKTAKESTAANQALQERVEQMRIANWVQITDASYISTDVLNTATGSAVGLPGVTETMTVASATNTTVTPAKITRSGNSVQVNTSNIALQNENLVRVDVKLVWKGLDKRQHTRSTCALIAKGGIAK